MTAARVHSGARNPGRRAAVLLAVILGLLVATIGPSNFASAAPVPNPLIGRGGPGWLASNNPVELTAHSARIYGLDKVTINSPVRRANGTLSPPDTVFLRVRKIEFDDTVIRSVRPDHTWQLSNLNGIDRTTQFILGNDSPSTKTGLWVVPNQLKLCLTPDTLNTLVANYKGVFGGRLDEVLLLISTVFQPYLEGPLRNVGPCIPIKELLPILQVLIDAGVPLPDLLPVIKLDITVHAAQVKTPRDQPSVRGPLEQVRMFQ